MAKKRVKIRKDGKPDKRLLNKGNPNIVPAPKGNLRAEKFKLPEERQNAYACFLDHMAQGYSQGSFCEPCTARTIFKMIELHPEEFDEEALDLAKAKAMQFWEKLGVAGAAGKIKNFNAASWIFNMKNRHGWRDKIDHDHGGDLNVNVTIKKWE